MVALPAIRQLVFLSADLDATLAAARSAFGLNEGIKDEKGMAALGFVHEVLTIDQTFLEFTAPLSPDTMPGRLLAKRGDLGYMVVIQVADIEATKQRAAALDLHPIFEEPYEGNSITQWHPRAFGTLAEFDEIRPPDTWHMAPRIFEHGSTAIVGDVSGIELAVADPVAMADRWASVLGIASGNHGATLDLSGRTVKFVHAADREGMVAVELPATDRTDAGKVYTISGVEFRLV